MPDEILTAQELTDYTTVSFKSDGIVVSFHDHDHGDRHLIFTVTNGRLVLRRADVDALSLEEGIRKALLLDAVRRSGVRFGA